MNPVKVLNEFSCWSLHTGEHSKFPSNWIIPLAFYKNENKTTFRDLVGDGDDRTLEIIDRFGAKAMLIIAPDGRIMLTVDTVSEFYDDRDQI